MVDYSTKGLSRIYIGKTYFINQRPFQDLYWKNIALSEVSYFGLHWANRLNHDGQTESAVVMDRIAQ